MLILIIFESEESHGRFIVDKSSLINEFSLESLFVLDVYFILNEDSEIKVTNEPGESVLFIVQMNGSY